MERLGMGADLMAGQIPPPPPGFVLQGAGASPPTNQTRSAQPRGIRNNNPGNIEDGSFARSLPGYAGTDGRFAIFNDSQAGEQAAPRLLQSYISRGFNTPNAIINRWAPPSDNNPTQAYASYVAQRVGVHPDQQVTQDQIPLIAQAIKEFENGQRVDGQPPADATNPTGMETGSVPPPPEGFVISDAPSAQVGEQVVDSGYNVVNGRVILDGRDVGTEAEYAASQRRSQADREARATRMADPKFQLASQEAARGSANVPEELRAVLNGQSLGFGNEINARIQGALQGLENLAPGEDRYSMADATQAARDSERDAGAKYAAEHPVANFGYQMAGGLLTPGIGPAGDYIAGAQGSARLARAAQIGGAYGAAAGFGNAEGNVAERLPEAILGGLTGAGTGAIGQGAVDRLTRSAGGVSGSAARRLSRQGVRLTPGQMVSETPVVGEFIRNFEDVAGGFNPLMAGVRRGQNEDVVRAAGNEALANIGAKLPKDARTGYQVSRAVRRVLGDRYNDVTSRITAQADQQLYDEYADLGQRAAQTLDDSNARRLERILNDKVINEFDANGQLTGSNFKRIEEALRQQSERASRPTSTLADNDLAEFIDEARDIARNLIARQYPEESEAIRNLNRGWATNKIIERAVTGSAGFSRSGTPTPGEVSQAVANSSRASQITDETALLQGLATDARTVLPSSVPDSGTAQKGLLAATAGVVGTGGAAIISPPLAAAIASGAIVYSRPGIAFLNALYRATDSQAANDIVRNLARLAQRDPALQPYYQAAAEHVLSLGQIQSTSTQPAQSRAPVPTPVQ